MPQDNQYLSHIEPLDIFCWYDQQRFLQFGAMDCANWYGVTCESGKKGQAMYPAMGRAHVNFHNLNKLIFNNEPHAIFRSNNFAYVVDGVLLWQIDRFFNQRLMTSDLTLNGAIWFDTLPVDTTTINLLTDGVQIFLITEPAAGATTCVLVTDANAPKNPTYVAAFGNRFVVASLNSPTFTLTNVNATGGASLLFTIGTPGAPLFARATGVIGQFAVLHNQLYIMCDYVTDVWANIQTTITVAGVSREFPWKQNSSYNFDYGIYNPYSLSVDFGMMCWLAQNKNGLITFMMSDGQAPQPISTQAINVLLQNSNGNITDLNLSNNYPQQSPFLSGNCDGFLYQWEDSIFYRASAGLYQNFGDLDITEDANAIEYNFDTKKWTRAIELNGERNRIVKHVYFNNLHLVTVQGDPAIYNMAGNLYYNETINKAQPNNQAPDAFVKFPMRYELITKQIYYEDYSEFMDEYVEIDFVFGNQTFYKSSEPFLDTVFIIEEGPDNAPPIFMVTEDGKYIIAEGSGNPTFDDNHYYALFKPHIELYYSDDGGQTFIYADNREFSQLGQYRYRMRWYELACSRNRCYKLICVSSAPIVILGACRNTRRTSGGAN